MVTITHKNGLITVKGHAGYAERGNDIICAGVSTLIQTLIKSIEDLTADKIDYTVTSGNVILKYGDLSELSQVLISSFFIGCELIANTYPDYVRLCKH